ncbi:MAG: helix-turn-helix transcriptional regulator [Acidobacteria bacterium]|nr:helix-turn-helix transcriptional regulator [Acidobacteriota bacterium]
MAKKGNKKPAGAPRKLTGPQRAKATREMAGRLAAARRESGLTQAAAARAVRLSPSLVSKIERGERRLDPLELARFARLYGKSIVDFIA